MNTLLKGDKKGKWVRKAQENIETSKKTTENKRFIKSILCGVLVAIFLAFFYGSAGVARFGMFFVPQDQLMRRIPVSIIIGILTGLIAYRVSKKEVIVICPKCGHVKGQDSLTKCPCGGGYCDLDEYEWHEH